MINQDKKYYQTKSISMQTKKTYKTHKKYTKKNESKLT